MALVPIAKSQAQQQSSLQTQNPEPYQFQTSKTHGERPGELCPQRLGTFVDNSLEYSNPSVKMSYWLIFSLALVCNDDDNIRKSLTMWNADVDENRDDKTDKKK